MSNETELARLLLMAREMRDELKAACQFLRDHRKQWQIGELIARFDADWGQPKQEEA